MSFTKGKLYMFLTPYQQKETDNEITMTTKELLRWIYIALIRDDQVIWIDISNIKRVCNRNSTNVDLSKIYYAKFTNMVGPGHQSAQHVAARHTAWCSGQNINIENVTI